MTPNLRKKVKAMDSTQLKQLAKGLVYATKSFEKLDPADSDKPSRKKSVKP